MRTGNTLHRPAVPSLGQRSSAGSAASVLEEVRTGMEAGRLMSEWTLLMSERREGEAQDVMTNLRAVLGAELARLIFGE